VGGLAFAVVACRLRSCQGAVATARRPGVDIEVVERDFEVEADTECLRHRKLGTGVRLFIC